MKTDVSGGKGRIVPARELSTAELVKETAHQLRELVGTQIELAKTELRADLAGEKKMIAGLGTAALAALTGVNMLLVTAILAMGTRMPGWVAGLLVSAFVLLVAGVAAAIGWKKRVHKPMARLRHALREDVRWTREKLA